MVGHAHHNDSDPLAILEAANDLLSRIDLSRLLAAELPVASRALSTAAGRVRLAQTQFADRARTLQGEGRAAPPEDLLGRGSGMSNEEAERIARQAEVLRAFPAFATALSDGAITADHVEVLRRHHQALEASDRALLVADGTTLANAARHLCVEDFRAHLAKRRREQERTAGLSPEQRSVRRNAMSGGIDGFSQRWSWNVNLDAVAGERLEHALRGEMNRLRNLGDASGLDPEVLSSDSRLRAVALGNLVSSGFQVARRAPSDGAACELGVITDLQTLLTGPHDTSVCQTSTGLPVDIETARRLACEAGWYPVVLSGDSIPLDVGATRRLATPAQRRAQGAVYETCAAHGCCTPFHECQIHHIDPWPVRQATDLDNLVPLCHRHHHLLHEGGWRAHLSDDRTFTLQKPDGTWEEPQPLRPPGRSLVSSSPPTAEPPGEPLDLFAAVA